MFVSHKDSEEEGKLSSEMQQRAWCCTPAEIWLYQDILRNWISMRNPSTEVEFRQPASIKWWAKYYWNRTFNDSILNRMWK